MNARHEELIAGWLDGSLGEPERTELLAALRADADLAGELAGETELHRSLQFAASRSEAGDRRAADRILHFVRASQEGSAFAEGVRQRAAASSRRSGRVVPRGASFGAPALAAAAAVAVMALAGLAMIASRPAGTPSKPEIAERPAAVERQPAPPPRETAHPGAPEPAEDDAARRRRIEEELRTAAGTRRPEAPPKREDAKAPPPPEVAPPKVEPPEKREPTRVEALPAPARLESFRGEVVVGADRLPAASGAELRDGTVLETVGAAGSAVVRFLDGTRVEISGEAKLHEKLAGRRVSGKGLALVRGSLSADVSKQPAGQSFLFVTPHAEVQVIGTRLSIHAGAETRVDVHEGQVRVTSLKNGQAAALAAGQGAELGLAGGPRPFLQGLRAVYFDQNGFKGLAIERVDSGIDLALDQSRNELPPVGADRNFAVRWEGRFLAEAAGEYVFLLGVDGQAKFVVDGQDLLSEPRGTFHPINRSVLRRKLAAGWHDVVLEYSDDQGNSRCVLRYVPPDAKVPDNDPFQADNSGFAIPPRLFTHPRR